MGLFLRWVLMCSCAVRMSVPRHLGLTTHPPLALIFLSFYVSIYTVPKEVLLQKVGQTVLSTANTVAFP